MFEKLTKGDRTKISIIESATELFFSEGLYNVTFARIAEGVGLSQASIYRHFADMDDLILNACLHWVGNAQNYIDKNEDEFKPAKDQLNSYIERNIAYSSRNRAHDGLLLGLYYYAMRSPVMLDTYRDIKNGGVARIERYLIRGTRDGSWKLEEPRDMAYIIHSLLVGEIIKLIIEPREYSQEVRLKRILSAVGKLLS